MTNPSEQTTTTAPATVNWPDPARVIAIFTVVLLHVSVAAVKVEPGTFEWWVGNFYDSFSRWCVPVLVMISGYLLLDPARHEGTRTFYRKRAARILIPLLFWTAFYLAWRVLRGYYKHEPVAALDLLQSVINGYPYGHLWFLYMIVGLYLFTPFLRKVLAAANPTETALLCAMGFVIVAADDAWEFFHHSTSQTFFLAQFVPFLPYFVAGHLLGRSAPALGRGAALAIAAVSVAGTASLSFFLWPSGFGLYAYHYTSITVIPMSLAVFLALRQWDGGRSGFWRKLAPLSFGVYLIHMFYFSVLGQFGVSIKLFNPAISIPALTISIFILSTFSAWVMSKLPGLRRCI